MRRNLSSRWPYAILFLLCACVLPLPVAAGAEIKAFVSIAPQAYLVREIGESSVDVEILVPPGQSPTTYEPTAQQLARLAGADFLFTTGVAIEKRLLAKIERGFPNLQVVATHAGITLRPIERHGDPDPDHGGTLDPHVWLDPKLAAKQARVIAAALNQLHPEAAGTINTNLDNLLYRIDSVNAAIADMLEPVRGRSIYVFHPAYGYFADAYGLTQVAIETHGKEPSARQLAVLIEQAARDSVSVLFIQPQFSRRQAEAIGEAIGARVETLDPLSENYLDNLMDMAEKIAAALGGERASKKKKQHQ
jgi:zinc transport system substrate-binding protein